MTDDIGFISLYDPETKYKYRAIVLVIQIRNSFNFCPVWKETTNKLVPIMKDDKSQYYIDISDPFAYELWSNKSLEERINEFNQSHVERNGGEVKIIKVATEADLNRANLPMYKEEGGQSVIIRSE